MKNHIMNFLFTILSKLPIWEWFCSKILAVYTTRIKGYPTFPIEKYQEVIWAIQNFNKDHKQCVYFFVLSDKKSLAAKLINAVGCRWTHAGVICADPNYILEMKPEGLVKRHILYALRECDYFAVVAYQVQDIEKYYRGLGEIEEQKDEFRYDFEQHLENGNKVFYCSEFIYALLVPSNNAVNDMIQTSQIYGREVFSPDDVYDWGTKIFQHSEVVS
jgi:hypothetical protein